MMNKFFLLFVFAFCLCASEKAYTQTNAQIQSLIQLDTVYDLKVQYQSSLVNGMVGALRNGHVWISLPNASYSDSVLLLDVDLPLHKMDTLLAYVPGLAFKVRDMNATQIAVSDNHISLLYTGAVAIVDIRQFKGKTQLEYNTVIPLAEKFSYVFLQQNRVVLARSYNYHPLEYLTPVRVSVYDFQGDSVYSDLIPTFDAIEFSHFAPHHWIAASDHRILVSQTTSYNISIYNDQLQKIDSIVRNPTGWNYIDSSLLTRLRESEIVKNHQAKELIDALSPVEDSISRLESVEFLTDSTLLVRYIPSNNKAVHRQRRYDLWKRSHGVWKCSMCDLIDEAPDENEVVDKKNYPVQGVYDVNFAQGAYFIKIEATPFVQPWGKTYKQVKSMNDDATAHSNPTYHMFVYKIEGN